MKTNQNETLRLSLNAQLHSIRNLILDIEAEVRNLEERVSCDDLTGLYRRNAFTARLSDFLNDAEKNSQNIVLMMIDIDHFKKINDTLGHSGGDEILVKVAQLLKSFQNENCVVGRFGGEEFILAMKSDEQSGEWLAEEIRKRILFLNCTVSIGVSHSRKSGLFEKDLIEDADVALYEAKRAGRNQVKRAA